MSKLIIAVQLEGQTYGELAAELGTSPDAIRMRLKRAMAALTRIFQAGVRIRGSGVGEERMQDEG